ncbi:hypothetical protein BJG92_02175 [Arthrobacter sp. SO5]|uniref:hypothetical protein n=1 Tax=Arthrobacter sp. SO5 TaxID=1897055 RepID=UPI001E61A838|nr:hypothetical protein [Arthrobacter sp. SO5]MCB5274638.1 hypothetical protein [Arthrobacter sp. SO5]
MTNSEVPTAALVGISRRAVIGNVTDVAETLALVCGPSGSGLDLQLISADIVLVRTAEDLAAQRSGEADAYLVVESGMGLMSKFLRDDRLSSSAQILWSFGLPIGESLVALGSLELPAGTMVTGFFGSPEHAILLSAVRDDATCDDESFQMGLKAARSEELWAKAYSDAERHAADRRLLHDLGKKHLSVLVSLATAGEPAPDGAAPGGLDADAAELQDELNGLKRKYAILERRYNSLAQSKLGRITLRIWDRKRLSAPSVRREERSKA